MPLRKQTQLQASLRNMVVPLYTRPALKFLSHGQEYEPLRVLIYGPDTSFYNPTPAETEALRELWHELRSDILAAQAEHMPKNRPWGCRFDRNRRNTSAS